MVISRKIVSVFLVIALLSIAFMPVKTNAQVLPAFGGWPAFVPIPCTCSFTLWSYFGLLYLNFVPFTGPLVYVPYATIPFAWYTPTLPVTPHLGYYIPAVQACWMYVGIACVPIPSIGAMAIVGTGLPGGL